MPDSQAGDQSECVHIICPSNVADALTPRLGHPPQRLELLIGLGLRLRFLPFFRFRYDQIKSGHNASSAVYARVFARWIELERFLQVWLGFLDFSLSQENLAQVGLNRPVIGV